MAQLVESGMTTRGCRQCKCSTDIFLTHKSCNGVCTPTRHLSETTACRPERGCSNKQQSGPQAIPHEGNFYSDRLRPRQQHRCARPGSGTSQWGHRAIEAAIARARMTGSWRFDRLPPARIPEGQTSFRERDTPIGPRSALTRRRFRALTPRAHKFLTPLLGPCAGSGTQGKELGHLYILRISSEYSKSYF